MGFENKKFLRRFFQTPCCVIYSESFLLDQDEESSEFKICAGKIIGIGISYTALAGPDIDITFDNWDRIDGDEANWLEWDGDGEVNPAITGVRFTNGPTPSYITLTVKIGY